MQLFSTNFILICTTNKNFVPIWKKKCGAASLVLSKQNHMKKIEKKTIEEMQRTEFVLSKKR